MINRDKWLRHCMSLDIPRDAPTYTEWLEQQLAELREGIKEHSQCFNADEGDPHDLALWSLLQEVVDE